MTEIDKEIEDINYMKDKCYNDIKTQINWLLSILDEIDKNIDNSDHQSILEKGYCMLTTKKNKIISSIKKLRKHKNLNLIFNNEKVKVKIIIQLDE
jgi:exonuclease VII large subunit